MKENKKVADFCERFHNIIREHELREDTKKIDDEEKASLFYNASKDVMTDVRRTRSQHLAHTKKDMTMEE